MLKKTTVLLFNFLVLLLLNSCGAYFKIEHKISQIGKDFNLYEKSDKKLQNYIIHNVDTLLKFDDFDFDYLDSNEQRDYIITLQNGKAYIEYFYFKKKYKVAKTKKKSFQGFDRIIDFYCKYRLDTVITQPETCKYSYHPAGAKVKFYINSKLFNYHVTERHLSCKDSSNLTIKFVNVVYEVIKKNCPPLPEKYPSVGTKLK